MMKVSHLLRPSAGSSCSQSEYQEPAAWVGMTRVTFSSSNTSWTLPGPSQPEL